MAESPEQRPTREAIIVLLLAVATALKTTWAMNSIGSVDLELFYAFARVLHEGSLAEFYRTNAIFNHTPLTGCGIRWLYEWSGGASDPHSYENFATVLRMASVVADIAVVLGLLWVRRLTGRPPWWALGLFALSPVSIMVSGFHGNIDPIMVALLFFAGVAVLREKPVLCGVLFAAACNVKAMPLLMAPLFFFHWWARGWRPVLRFTGVAGAGLLLGAAWPLVQCPGPFLAHVLGYSSLWGSWGIPYWLRMTGRPEFATVDFQDFNGSQALVIAGLKVVVIAAVFALAWRRRKAEPAQIFGTLGAAYVFLFVFAPGAGTQYMVWCAPFILLLAPRWWAVLTAAATVYMAIFYHAASGFTFPWNEAFPRPAQLHYWVHWTNLPWAVFIGLLVTQGCSWFLPKGQAGREGAGAARLAESAVACA